MTDLQLLTLALAVIVPLSLLIYSNSRISDLRGDMHASITTFEVFTRVGPDNSLERLTERSVGLVTDQPSDVYELFVTLL